MTKAKPHQTRAGEGDYVRNTGWLLLGRGLRLALGVGIGIWVARYLGPDEFGLLSYALSLALLGSALAVVGLDSMVVRELIEQEGRRAEILGTAFGLRLLAGILVWLTLCLVAAVPQSDPALRWLLVLVGLDAVLQSFNVIDLHFQARVQSRYVVWAGMAAMIVAAILRVGLVLGGAHVMWFGVAFVVESASLAVGLLFFYRWQARSDEGWSFSWAAARLLWRDCWPLIISGVAISAYMRIDQIMIKALMDTHSVGIYAAASRISEAWYFVPMLVGTSLHPWIVDGRRKGAEVYEARLIKLYAMMGWGAVLVAASLTWAGPWMIAQLFGPAYAEAGTVLQVHVWAGVWLAVGIAAGKWFIAENHTRGAMRKALLGLSCNVVGNLFLIPRWGLMGAAASTIAGHFAANVVYDVLDPKVRPQLVLKIRALVLWNVFRP